MHFTPKQSTFYNQALEEISFNYGTMSIYMNPWHILIEFVKKYIITETYGC